MAVWNGAQETLTARTTPALACHIGGCPGLVDEDELRPIDPWLPIAPSRACSRYVRPALLGGVERLFLSVSLRALRNRSTEERPTLIPSCANAS